MRRAWLWLVLTLAAAPALGQYTFDPSAADELDKPGVLYFGSARDERGAYVADVLVVLENIQTNFTLVTDARGRFRAKLPAGSTLSSVRASCSKPGFVQLRVVKRPGAKKSEASVQVDCTLRKIATLGAQRTHAKQVLANLGQFETWVPIEQLFGAEPASTHDAAHQRGDAPLITFTQFNAAAADHVRSENLASRARLDVLRARGKHDASFAGFRSIPDFPREAIVVKSAWWPVAAHQLTPLPVWDAPDNPLRKGGNDYPSWRRIVAIDTTGAADRSDRTTPVPFLEFVGRTHEHVRRIPLEAFRYTVLDGHSAATLMRNPSHRKAALLALGRPLTAGDALALVALHVATKEIRDWVWLTVWWHDRETDDSPWPHYRLEAAFDAVTPREADGSPHVAFNPWLEARFPDGGAGNGTRSNCLACHQRASFPSPGFLPVRRGAADLGTDPAFAPGQLRTNFLWSVAQRAR